MSGESYHLHLQVAIVNSLPNHSHFSKNLQNTLRTLFTLKFCSMTCKLSSVNVTSLPNPIDPREQCSNGGICVIQLTNMS